MGMLDQFQKLDDLISELEDPKIRNKLRNQLHLTREQIEAYQQSAEKQDQTLATQAETISKLKTENQELAAKHQEVVVALEEKYRQLELKFENGKRCGYTRKTGEFVPVSADTHAVVPNWYTPQWVEFRRIVSLEPKTYEVLARVPWSEVAEVHNASQ